MNVIKLIINTLLPVPQLSLRVRYLFATSILVFILSLAYGLVAITGYIISFDKNAYKVMRGESNLFFTLASWEQDKLVIKEPQTLQLNFPTLVFIYDEHGRLLWQLQDVPEIRNKIKPSWLKSNDLHEINTNIFTALAANRNNRITKKQLENSRFKDSFTHSVAINRYAATPTLPALIIAVVDTIPQELQHSDVVWSWFVYVLIANIIVIIPLLWIAAHWSLLPIGKLSAQLEQVEAGSRDSLDPYPPGELRGLVSNLNLLLHSERQRSLRYHTTLSDLTHSLKTPLAVLQSTLRSVRHRGQQSFEEAEPVMLDQISRISQQIGYYLNRATLKSDQTILSREVHSVPALLDSLCFALNKVYQQKGVSIAMEIPPELTFRGDKDDFMEVIGNVLDNACKYCLEFIEISSRQTENALHIYIDDDGPGIPNSKREIIFQRGQRIDTMRPGQGIGLTLAKEIVESYQGDIVIHSLEKGGTRMEVIFLKQ